MSHTDTLCLDLLEVLYDEVDEQLSNWVAFLERLATLTEARATMIRSSDQETGEGRALLSAGLTAEQMATYQRLYHPAAVQALGLNVPSYTDIGAIAPIDLTAEPVAKSPFAQHLGAVGASHLLNVVFDIQGPRVFSLTLVRGPNQQEAFGDDEIALVRRLRPHLTRAAHISRHLRHLAGIHAAMTRTMDHLPLGVILTSIEGKVVAQNRAARGFLARRDGLRIDPKGLLRATSASEQERLAHLLGAATAPAALDQPIAGTLSLRRRNAEKPVFVLATAAGQATTGLLTDEALATLFLFDPDHPTHSLRGATPLRELWKLSPKEAQIAQLLVRGQSVPEVATTLDVKPSTVRTHLQRIHAKTQTSRQTELVSLLSWSVAVLDMINHQ